MEAEFTPPPEIPEEYRPKRLDLPQAEIDRLKREKAELLQGLRDKMPSPPVDLGAPLNPAIETQSFLTGRITADGRKLAGLMSKAKKLEAIAEALGEKANSARQAAHTARLELNNYMTQTGLA